MHAIQRRTEISAGPTAPGKHDRNEGKIIVDDLELDPARQTLLCKGENIELTAVQFSILHQLLANAGKVVSRDKLAEDVLGRKLEMFDRSIDVHISSLRKKLDCGSGGRERIKSVRGVGYQYLVGAQ